MRIRTLIRLSLLHYWRTNLAVIAGVAITVTVLAGALLVGDSVRGSLHDLYLPRLGNTAYVIAADGFFREALAEDLQAHPQFGEEFRAAAPLITLEGMVTHEASARRGSGIQVYGVDEHFWRFHEQPVDTTSQDRAVLLSPSLADEFGASVGDSILVRVQKPSAIPTDSLHGQRSDLSRSIRLRVGAVLAARDLGEFSLRPHQGAVRAVFLPLRRLQRNLRQEGKVNAILVSETGVAAEGRDSKLRALLAEAVSLEDLGVKLRILERQGVVSLESERILIADRIAEIAQGTAKELALRTTAIFSYLANAIRTETGEIPYSLVTAINPTPAVGGEGPSGAESVPPIWLNDWAFRDLGTRLGDVVTLDYYVWEEGGELLTRSAQFRLRSVLPMRGLATDSDLAPDFPGIAESDSVSEWNPPFSIDLNRIRDRDEDYWDRYHAAPKAFLPLVQGQRLWRSRYGQLTALRLEPVEKQPLREVVTTYGERLQAALDPLQVGFVIHAARGEGIEASRGAVNFGEYFFYFSFFLVASAVLLTGLFFRLGVEERLREIGLLQAVGFPHEKIRVLFLGEGLVLAILGSTVGVAGAVAYGWLMMFGLRTWWVDAVGTALLTLHISFISLFLGGLAGVVAAFLVVFWTLRSLRSTSPRNLLTGTQEASLAAGGEARKALYLGIGCALLGLALVIAALFEWINQVAGFFGSGTLLLAALISFQWVWLSRRRRGHLVRPGRGGVTRLGFRNAAWRPGRSLLCIALVASATFILVAVESFRHEDTATSLDPHFGTGGFALLAETLIPLPYDPNTADGREYMNLSDNEVSTLESVRFAAFRLRPGEDASCLNLYQPRNPKILAVPADFVESGRFAFQDSLAQTLAEKENPWKLLETKFSDGAVPAIVDANTMTYILHLGLGGDFVLTQTTGKPIHLRIVAALADSIFQSELLISEKNFLRLFPHVQGFRFFLLDLPPTQAASVAAILEERLSDSGLDVIPSQERLATFHRVENTYLSTFQALGKLGLLLGTFGLAAVLLRNVLERRREMALLRAVGYRRSNLALLVLAENALLLALGLVSGIGCALLAIVPALSARGGELPAGSLSVLLIAVFVTGLAASFLAVVVVMRAPLLPDLRAE